MKEKRMWKNTWLKGLAIRHGLEKGKKIIVEERSLLRDYTYITREIRRGVVLELYPHHFYCQMENGRRESFRYNEFLGHEARLIHLKGKIANKKASEVRMLFYLRKGLGNKGSLLCYAKQALPATPSWVVSYVPNGIRSRNLFPARKTGRFKAFQPMERICLFFCFNKSKS